MSVVSILSKANAKTGSYEAALTVSIIKSWKNKSFLFIECESCKGEGCSACKGKGKVNPFISGTIYGKETRSKVFTFSHEELAWGLSGSSNGEYRMIMAKYIDTEGKERLALLSAAITEARIISNLKGWRTETFKQETLELAAITAIDEILDEKTCYLCKGKGQIRSFEEGEGVKFVTCFDKPRGCGGIGYKDWSMRKRAQGCGLHPETFRSGGWNSRYMIVLNEFKKWESTGLARIYWRTRGDA